MSKKVAILAVLVVISLLLVQNTAYSEIPVRIDDTSLENEYLNAQAGWLGDWWYRKSHTITGGSDVGANFQMSFTVYYGYGVDSNNEVHCQMHCQNDFGDLRFTSSDGVTEYDYWIQNITTGVQALFWVEIAETLNVSRTMYIYYGNPSATSQSNGSETFIYFEDFSRPDSETVGNGWTEDVNQTHVSISNGALNVTGVQHQFAHVETPLDAGVNLVLEGNIYSTPDEFGDYANSICVYWSDHVWIRAGWRYALTVVDGPDPVFFSQMNKGTGASEGGHGIPWETGNKWYRFRIILGYTTRALHSLDDGYTWDMIPYPTVRPAEYAGAPTHIILGRGYSDSPTGYYPNPDLDNTDHWETFPEATSFIDDVFVRAYSVYVPQHDVYGSEEPNSTVDSDPPVISQPADVTFVEGTTGHEITWTLTDESPHNYTVWKQDELYDFGDWDTSPMNVTVSLDGVTEGVYIFSMVAIDDFLNFNFDQVLVTVTVPVTTTSSASTTPTSPTTPTEPSGEPPDILFISLVVGTGLVILVVVVLILKRKTG